MAPAFDLETELHEYARLARWRTLWRRLAEDRRRMRRLGGLQTTMEKVERRARLCNNRIAAIMSRYDEHQDAIAGALVELRTFSPQALATEVAAWRLRFPEYAFVPTERCVTTPPPPAKEPPAPADAEGATAAEGTAHAV